jgi:hypothetical protein
MRLKYFLLRMMAAVGDGHIEQKRTSGDAQLEFTGRAKLGIILLNKK